MQSGEFDIVVAGCGIAGLNAGLASARLGRKTLVLAGGLLGGQLLSIGKIDGFPGFPDGVPGYELCPMAQEQAAAAGAEFAATEFTRPRAARGALADRDRRGPRLCRTRRHSRDRHGAERAWRPRREPAARQGREPLRELRRAAHAQRHRRRRGRRRFQRRRKLSPSPSSLHAWSSCIAAARSPRRPPTASA